MSKQELIVALVVILTSVTILVGSIVHLATMDYSYSNQIDKDRLTLLSEILREEQEILREEQDQDQ